MQTTTRTRHAISVGWATAALLGAHLAPAVAGGGDWITLFNGTSLEGWRASENPASLKVVDGQIVTDGPRAHLFYVGPVRNARFRNFEFETEVLTRPGANSGIYFHTRYQERDWPSQGYEIQLNHSATGEGNYRELKRTGSLYGVRNLYLPLVPDDAWFKIRLRVEGRRVQVWLDDLRVVDYTEPAEPPPDPEYAGRRLSEGTFALQCHDPASRVCFRQIRVRPLPDDLPSVPAPWPLPAPDYPQLASLYARNFPVIDLHAHLKGGLTADDVVERTHRTGINYGVAVNCGLGFGVTNDAGIHAFVDSMRGYPFFVAMQAEGREWVNLFSREAIGRFDYVFTDAMTFTDDRGKRTRLWIPEEVDVPDPEAFMDLLVDRITRILDTEPIDIYVNPTYLPEIIAAQYDRLWTPERRQRVIDAAVRNRVALEINDRFRIPSAAFIKQAKQAGAKFTFGTNNGGRDDLGHLQYCLQMQRECGLTWQDMFVPDAKPRAVRQN